jgi:hypothetical protein
MNVLKEQTVATELHNVLTHLDLMFVLVEIIGPEMVFHVLLFVIILNGLNVLVSVTVLVKDTEVLTLLL